MFKHNWHTIIVGMTGRHSEEPFDAAQDKLRDEESRFPLKEALVNEQ